MRKLCANPDQLLVAAIGFGGALTSVLSSGTGVVLDRLEAAIHEMAKKKGQMKRSIAYLRGQFRLRRFRMQAEMLCRRVSGDCENRTGSLSRTS